jgi:CheY-like chemotaxis protein
MTKAHKGKVLIIDDDEDILEAEGALLRDSGFTILSSLSMEDGLTLVETEQPDVVLLDLVFPEDPESGIKAAHEIRRLHPTLPVFLLTSLNRRHLTGIREGDPDFDEILAKPVNIENLISLIASYIGRVRY